ncbi:ral-GDS-related protein-like [Manis javanica]|uniref:ral-GDS-related protein-like n=1 Tax=Manis javanica TaxID=9974 RepID=UPI003C6D008E
MALILAEPEPCPESISPCGVNTWDIPGVVSCPELESDVPSECSRPTPSPGMRLAGCHTWEPKHVPSVLHGSQLSSIPEGRVLHHLVQEEHVGPTVAEMEEPRQMQMAPEAQGGPDSSLEPVEDPRETPVLELRPVSPASGPAEPEDVPAVAATPVPGPELQPHEPSGMVPGPLDGMAPGLAEPEAVLEPTSPCAVNTWDVPREEEPTILAFPPRLVAEQLTLMCASQMGGLELLAPTIHRIIRQCGDTANLVTSSCLGAPSMTSRDKGPSGEVLDPGGQGVSGPSKNFASLRAILLALQSPAVRRLESTWRHVPWKSSRIYKNLKKRDKGINRKWLLEEAKSIATKLLWATRGSQGRKQQVAQGMVPFLGLFLDDLLVDKLPEHNEDGDKTSKRVLSVVPHKVTLVLGEILMHKRMAALYYLEPDEHFFKSFFQAVEPMDEEER